MVFRRLRVCGRIKFSTLLLFIFLSALFMFLVNHMKPEKIEDDILNPRFLQQDAYRQKIAGKFHFDEDDSAPVQLCKVPTLSLKADVNDFAFHAMNPLQCTPGDIFYLQDYALKINHTALDAQNLTRCEYKAIEWENDSEHHYSEPLEKTYPGPYELRIKNEFFRVECYLERPKEARDEMTSMEQKYRYDTRRRLLQANDLQHQARWKVASDEAINKVISDGGLQKKSIKDIVQNVQMNQHGGDHQNTFQHQAGGNVNSDVRVVNNEPPRQSQQNAELPVVERNSLKSPPGNMGSVGLPDFPLINAEHTKQIYNAQKEKLLRDTHTQNIDTLNNQPTRQSQSNKEIPVRERNTGNFDKSVNLAKIPRDNKTKIPSGDDGNYHQVQSSIKPENEVKERAPSSKEDIGDKASEDTGDGTNSPYSYNYMGDPADMETPIAQFFAQIVPKEEVLTRIKEMPKSSSEQMNVLIIGMDSMSHLTYQRKMPKTYDYIQRKLQSVVMNGYNIVGDATTAAIIPITTGHSEVELPEVRKNKEGSTFVDAYPLIWNKFEQRGYVTLFSEDKPDISVFNMRLNGFEEIPTDHYMRPFYLATLSSEYRYSWSEYCTGSRPSHKYMLDYLKQFFERYPKEVNKFAFAFLTDLSHDDNNPAEYIDQDMVDFLEGLRVKGHLDNTVVVLMADHGARYSKLRTTTQGKLEERLPMMSFAFPPWYQKKYPSQMRHLRMNADRLTTPFDVHATLMSIVDLPSLNKPLKKGARGRSLLRAHPLHRTCSDAGVDAHWCTCMNWQHMDPTNWRVVTAAKKLVEHINGLSEKHRDICSELTLKEVKDVKIGLPNDKVLKFVDSSNGGRVANFTDKLKSDTFYLQIIVRTVPGLGLYEGTVVLSSRGTTYQVMPDISRVSKYGQQAHCVVRDFPDLRSVCYCNSPPPTLPPKQGRRQHAKRRRPPAHTGTGQEASFHSHR